MPNYCKIIVAGHLGRDPEAKDINGKALSKFSVAVTEKNGDIENTSWFDVSAWGKQAESCNKYLAKGRAVIVEGKMRSRKFEKDGEKRTAWEIVADRVVFLPSGEKRPDPLDPPEDFFN